MLIFKIQKSMIANKKKNMMFLLITIDSEDEHIPNDKSIINL